MQVKGDGRRADGRGEAHGHARFDAYRYADDQSSIRIIRIEITDARKPFRDTRVGRGII